MVQEPPGNSQNLVRGQGRPYLEFDLGKLVENINMFGHLTEEGHRWLSTVLRLIWSKGQKPKSWCKVQSLGFLAHYLKGKETFTVSCQQQT